MTAVVVFKACVEAILKPERMPIEANVWGTPKSSGSFSNLFRSRLLRAIDYRRDPTELALDGASRRVCSPPFSEAIEPVWPAAFPRERPDALPALAAGHNGDFIERGIYLSCGTSSDTGLAAGSIDLVVTDPPFFDNVHYSELADFFYAWQQLDGAPAAPASTRSAHEVQDTRAEQFASKLAAVFRECHRILRDDGLLVFTYHHSRDDGWHSLAEAILGAGFTVVSSQPVKAEMSVATPKSAAKEPIAFDIILVCRKQPLADTNPTRERGDPDPIATCALAAAPPVAASSALASAQSKIDRLLSAGFILSRNDRKIILYGQLLTTLGTAGDAAAFAALVASELSRDARAPTVGSDRRQQQELFERV